jgi:hypothetical protein
MVVKKLPPHSDEDDEDDIIAAPHRSLQPTAVAQNSE